MTRQKKSLMLLLFATLACEAEVYQWQDEYGRLQFSDQPPEHIKAESVDIPDAQGYQQGSHSAAHIEKSANQLKSDRLNREESLRRERKRKQELHAAWQKKKKEKKANQAACAKAQKQADLAFRSRMQRTNLNAASNAFERYEKARQKMDRLCD